MKMNKLHFVTPVAVIRRDDGRILILKRRQGESVYPGHYTFPGGKVEGNETIMQALKREVAEECGLNILPGAILIKDKAILRPDGQTSKALSFLCSVESSDSIKLNREDFSEYMWANLDELRKVQHVGIEAEFQQAERLYKTGIDVKKIVI